jgi:signal transduction histidine kinase/DNA-binding response OmpR family regulator
LRLCVKNLKKEDSLTGRHEIFIIDDDFDFRNYLKTVLTIEGYKTTLFDSGRMALEAAETRCPAVALIDLRLGSMNGLDVLEAIKKRCPSTECILLTGHASTTSAIEAINVGAYGYLQKPYDLQQLLIMLRRAVEKQAAGMALTAYTERLKTLLEIDQAILQARSPQAVAEAALSRMRRLVLCQRIGVTTFDFEASEGLFLAVKTAVPSNLGTDTHLPLDSFRLSDSLRAGHIQVVEAMDTRNDLTAIESILQSEGLTALRNLPLIAQGKLIGTLDLGTSRDEQLTEEDIEIAREVADQVAVAVQQALLHQQIREHAAKLEERVRERTAELNQANKKLIRASRLKDDFLANMSHELRTPLNAILGLSEALEEGTYGPLSARQTRSVRTIYESGQHLLLLINDILDISKSVADKLELDFEPVSVVSLCEAALRMVRQEAQKKGIKVNSSFDTSLRMIEADERRLKQILVNLLSNAVKFTPEGREIGLEVVGDTANKLVQFTVWDKGVGISKEQMADLFEPFVQLDNSLTRQQTGTGLGLVMALRLTELHNGTLAVESEVGVGSRFVVSLPWIVPEETAVVDIPPVEFVAAPTEEAPVPPPAPDVPVSMERPLILLAEDNENLIEIYADYIQSNDYRVVIARDGLEALALAHEAEPNLMLIDVQMPRMDGLEVMRQLRAEARFAAVPIIALTAHVMPEDKERCLQAGATDYLSKPSSIRQILAMIEKYVAPVSGSR